MTAARLQTHSSKAKVYKNFEGDWCVARSYSTEVWKYHEWKKAFNNAYMAIRIMRRQGL